MNNFKLIDTSEAPAAIGPYSQAVVAGEWVFASGQIPLDPSTGEVVEGEVERLAVVGGDHQVTHLPTEASLGQEIAQGEEVAERLAHLFTLHKQVRAVHPVLNKFLPVALQAGAFTLGDLVLVVGEHQVFAAEV